MLDNILWLMVFEVEQHNNIVLPPEYKRTLTQVLILPFKIILQCWRCITLQVEYAGLKEFFLRSQSCEGITIQNRSFTVKLSVWHILKYAVPLFFVIFVFVTIEPIWFIESFFEPILNRWFIPESAISVLYSRLPLPYICF